MKAEGFHLLVIDALVIVVWEGVFRFPHLTAMSIGYHIFPVIERKKALRCITILYCFFYSKKQIGHQQELEFGTKIARIRETLRTK